MPTYTYQCKKCDHAQDVFHAMSASPRVRCSKCGSGCRRLIGMGSGIIFKGSGFYETDYKRGKEKLTSKTDEGGKAESKTETTSETKTETKSESKTESKTESKSESKSETKSSSDKSVPAKKD